MPWVDSVNMDGVGARGILQWSMCLVPGLVYGLDPPPLGLLTWIFTLTQLK